LRFELTAEAQRSPSFFLIKDFLGVLGVSALKKI
jgi:hypothetical protein